MEKCYTGQPFIQTFWGLELLNRFQEEEKLPALKNRHQKSLNGELVPNDFSSFHLHLLVQPLPVAAALDAALARPALGARVEAAHAVHVQAVAHVLAVGQQPAFAVVHFALGRGTQPAW